MPDRLCALLVRRGRPLEVGHVAAQLLRLRRCPERLQRKLVAEIVEGDARLAWLGPRPGGPRAAGLVGHRPGRGRVLRRRPGDHRRLARPLEGHRDRRRARAGPRGGRALRDAGRPGPADPGGRHRAHRHRRRHGAGAPRHRRGARGLHRVRRPGRARRAQRALRPAVPQLRAAPAGGQVLHPAVARHPGAGAAPAQRAGRPPRPGDARGVGRHQRPPDPPGAPRRRGDRRGARAARRRCSPTAASTPSSARWPSPASAARATRTSWRWPRTCPSTPGVYLMRDARRADALRRQGRQPAPAGAVLLRPRAGATAGSSAGRWRSSSRSTTSHAGRSSPPCCWRTGSSRSCGRPATSGATAWPASS